MPVRKNRNSGNKKTSNDDKAENSNNMTWKDYIMIEPDSRKKALFDVIVLFFIGYSCVTSVYNVAFNFAEPQNTGYESFLDFFDVFVEVIFFIDLFLNFIWCFNNPDT